MRVSMRLSIVTAVALVAGLGLAQGASATPSFMCRGALSPTEQAICDAPILGDLDRVMANLYATARADRPKATRKALQQDQKLWLRWRDTCGTAADCLRRRYEQRIIDLAPAGQLPPGFGCAESPYGGIHIRAGLVPPTDGRDEKGPALAPGRSETAIR